MPWKILKMTDKGRGAWYRYHVSGENTEAVPQEAFHWSVRDVKDDRYGAHSDASPEVKAMMAKAKGAPCPCAARRDVEAVTRRRR